MILLAQDCLCFELPDGTVVPVRSEAILVEVSGEAADWFDDELISQALAAVFHYFKHDLERLTVTVEEFANALKKVLRRLAPTPAMAREWTADLADLARQSGGSELAFFTQLRKEIRGGLRGQHPVLRFHELEACVRDLAGARRWCARCRELRDRIVDYLRRCLAADAHERELAVVVE